MEAQASVNQPATKNGTQHVLKKKRKLPQHSADIVFTKGTSIHTMPSLSKLLKDITDVVIGLQYVWEYRSPSKSVPPHYQCKLCAVCGTQHDMVAHVKGWKHCFKYMQKAHPDKVTCEKADAVGDLTVRKTIKEAGAEVEKTEGRGQIKVILKEPYEVPAFKVLCSAAVRVMPPPAPGMGLRPSLFSPRFNEPRFRGEFPRPGGHLPPYPVTEYGEPGFGGYSDIDDFCDSGPVRNFPGGMSRPPARSGDGFGPGGERDGYGRSGMREGGPARMHPEEYHSVQMGSSSMDRPGLMGAAPESSNPSNSLLSYLDNFRIENENDAQVVLKVTQKLTDVLMEYRLRSVSAGSSLTSSSLGSASFSSTPSRLSNNSDRYSSSLSGPSRYPDIRPRFYK